MKLHGTHFEEYIQKNEKTNLLPMMENIYKQFPKNIQDFRNVIFYGPSGVGKYTQMLSAIKQYSPSKLKYEKKFMVVFDKKTYFYKISDIHFEIDMSLLGCQSRLLWNEIYYQILDVISTKNNKVGIIVCKYFHEIHHDLLDSFYSYMQTLNKKTLILKFIIITEQISFIPDNILKCCKIISIPRPSKLLYNKCLLNKLDKNVNLYDISNIKNIQTDNFVLMKPYELICNKIINELKHANNINFSYFRDLLYEIFIYNLDINECIWFILLDLFKNNNINDKYISNILIKTFTFLQYYNNNYRPIYHLENYLLYLVIQINAV